MPRWGEETIGGEHRHVLYGARQLATVTEYKGMTVVSVSMVRPARDLEAAKRTAEELFGAALKIGGKTG